MSHPFATPDGIVSIEDLQKDHPFVLELLNLMMEFSFEKQNEWFTKFNIRPLITILYSFQKIRSRITLSEDGKITAPNGIRLKHVFIISTLMGRCNQKITRGITEYQSFLDQFNIPKQKIFSIRW
jgi:hypothetical protein